VFSFIIMPVMDTGTQDTGAPATFLTSGGQAAAPPAFHIMLKPRGAVCNLDCAYCYFLSKELMYPGSRFRMADELLEAYTRQYIDAQRVPEVTFAWQGGEPLLMGLDFYRRAIELQQRYRKPGMRIHNALQTNGTLLNEDWCDFFRDHQFLIGLSLDGPRALHDAYRVDKGGQPTFDRVMAGLALLKQRRVEFNILTTVHAANAGRPLEVYRFLRDEAGTQFIQFIPIVERVPDGAPDGAVAGLYIQAGRRVTDRSVTARVYGDFLIAIFDEWARRDIGRVYVQMFDVALAAWSGHRPGLCIFDETCGTALAMEHNGDLFSCDHFVEPAHKLGNIADIPLVELVGSEQQRRFGQAKRDTLPRYCRECPVRFACHGGCPKERFILSPDGEPGLNYLCAGLKAFFTHVDESMRFMAGELAAGRAPANLMRHLRSRDAELERRFAAAGRNDPCPCGSGRKFKHCHGRS
jgi:uncharacterized protein